MVSRKKLLASAVLVALCAALVVVRHVVKRAGPRLPMPNIPDSIPPSVRRPFRAGEELVYSFGWNGVECARLRMSLLEEEKDGIPRLVVDYEGHTHEAIAWAWTYRMSGKTYLDPQTLLPSLSVLTTESKDKTKRFTTTFDRSAGVAHAVTEKLYKNTRKERQVPFKMGLDLGGAIFFARTLELPMGKPTTIETLHEKMTYAVELTPMRREKIRVGAGTFDALAVDVRLQAAAGSAKERAEHEAKFRKACIWFSADDRWLPLKMESEVFVGTVYAELISVRP